MKLKSIAMNNPKTKGYLENPMSWACDDKAPYECISFLRGTFSDSFEHFSFPRTISNFDSITDSTITKDLKISELLSDSPTTYYPKSKKALLQEYARKEGERWGVSTYSNIFEGFKYV